MDAVSLVPLDLFKALTLAERTPDSRELTPDELNISQQRFNTWRSQFPFENPSIFKRRLDTAALSEKEFRAILGLPAFAASKNTPDWLFRLFETYDQCRKKPVKEVSRGFLPILTPLLNRAVDRLETELISLKKEYPHIPLDPVSVTNKLASELPRHLDIKLNRALVVELRIAKLSGELTGETPEIRFEEFVRKISNPTKALEIWCHYPVLPRLIQDFLDRWCEGISVTIRRLARDWKEITQRFFDGDDPGNLQEFQLNAGDLHNGQSVSILVFEDDRKILFKPKSLSTDLHFQELLDWVSSRGWPLPFKIPPVWDRGDYGWSGHVRARPCESSYELKHFYFRQGGLLALFHLVDGIDMHLQNIMAVGPYPVPIDLETLFHPYLLNLETNPKADLLEDHFLDETLLRVGMLPVLSWEHKGGADFSALATKDQQWPLEVPYFEREGTDEMRIAYRTQSFSASNRPKLRNQGVEVSDFVDCVADGFREMMVLIERHREALVAHDGPIQRFANDQTRVVFRASSMYKLLLQDSYHPDVLYDALARDRHFDKLWMGVSDFPFIEKIIPAEREDLLRGDLPLFHTSPGSRDLFTSTGKRIPDFFPDTAYERVMNKLNSLDENKLERDVWFVNSAILASTIDEKPKMHSYPFSLPTEDPNLDEVRERSLNLAIAAGNRLAQLALYRNEQVYWPTVAASSRGRWALRPTGPALYDGVSGIALFLSILGKLVNEEKFTALASRAMHHLELGDEIGHGGFSGAGGIIFTYSTLYSLTGEAEHLRKAQGIIRNTVATLRNDCDCDVVTGSAGLLLAIMTLEGSDPQEDWKETLVDLGNLLVSRAIEVRSGLGWPTSASNNGSPIAGFAHGSSGIGYALIKLGARYALPGFVEAGQAAWKSEESLFRPEQGNWLDLRQCSQDQETFATAWCHGAPGIGLSRLAALPHLNEYSFKDTISQAIAATKATGFGQNFGLCHGDLGNLAFIQAAAQAGYEETPTFTTYAHAILDAIEMQGWKSGVPFGLETPGLMNGTAGMGLQLLRIAEPERVPNILVLEDHKDTF